jgi:hypothetical protein
MPVKPAVTLLLLLSLRVEAGDEENRGIFVVRGGAWVEIGATRIELLELKSNSVEDYSGRL